MTPCQWLPARASVLLLLLLASALLAPATMAQGGSEDAELRRLREGASRLRELQVLEGGAAPGPQHRVEKPPVLTEPPPASPPPSATTAPAARADHPMAPAAAVPEARPPAVESLTAADWQTLRWRQDTLAERIDAETGELTRRLLALEERISQLSVTLSWLSSGIALLLGVIGLMAIRLRRPPAAALPPQAEAPPPPDSYLPLPPFPQGDRLAACELLLFSGHYRQCLQQSQEAMAEATPEELPLLLFFETAARRLLGEDSGRSEERLRACLRRTRPLDWPLAEIDSWMLLAEMKEEDRRHLGALLDALRPSQWTPPAKENPSGQGGVLSY